MHSSASPWTQVRAFLRHCRHAPRLYAQQRALRALADSEPRRMVIGSSGTSFEGWVSTDREVIDLLRESTWTTYFKPDFLDAILAEHVWEHLSSDDALRSARTCYRFLRPGGHLRVAVPDGFHPDPAYIEAVRPGGSGSGADDHKLLYNHVSFSDLFASVGFDVRLYEYFDETGEFHFSEWNPADGMIQRSKRFDSRNSSASLPYTSIVMDAVKPPNASR